MKAKIKRKLFLILGLIPVVLVMETCSTDWLEPKPLSIFTPENAFVDSRGMYAALTASDALIRDEWFTTGNRTPINTECTFSEVSVDGSTDVTSAPMNMHLVIVPGGSQSNLYINWYWQNGYQGIKYANLVISRINDTKFANEAERNAVLGTAYFHRSYWYYRLTHQFGDVPFIGQEIKTPKLDFYSTQRDVILQKIKKDMEFAVQWVSDNVDRGRPTKGACYHLLTKICLALGDFDGAIAAANAVINGGVYSLMLNPFGNTPKEAGNFITSYLGITRNDVVATLHWYENKALPANKEVLYMVLSRENLVDSRLNIRSMYRVLPAWSKIGQLQLYTPDGYGPGTSDSPLQEIPIMESIGRGQAMIRSTSYFTKWIWQHPVDANDLRHKRGNWMEMEDLVYNHTATKKGIYYGKPLQFRDANGKVLTLDTIRNWFAWPQYKSYIPDPRATQPLGGAGDWYVFRLAETYLLRSEAYFWKGNIASAMADLNAVRTRCKAAPLTDANGFNIGTILDERARELFWEEMRKTELTRMAFIYAKTGKQCYNGKTYSLANISEDNFWIDRINERNDFYNKGVVALNGLTFTMDAKHILWPIATTAIKANTGGVINQNFGYDGYENNVPPLTEIPKSEDN
jgi:starch-binding outer membrane protein, SusD/RagB family